MLIRTQQLLNSQRELFLKALRANLPKANVLDPNAQIAGISYGVLAGSRYLRFSEPLERASQALQLSYKGLHHTSSAKETNLEGLPEALDLTTPGALFPVTWQTGARERIQLVLKDMPKKKTGKEDAMKIPGAHDTDLYLSSLLHPSFIALQSHFHALLAEHRNAEARAMRRFLLQIRTQQTYLRTTLTMPADIRVLGRNVLRFAVALSRRAMLAPSLRSDRGSLGEPTKGGTVAALASGKGLPLLSVAEEEGQQHVAILPRLCTHLMGKTKLDSYVLSAPEASLREEAVAEAGMAFVGAVTALHGVPAALSLVDGLFEEQVATSRSPK